MLGRYKVLVGDNEIRFRCAGWMALKLCYYQFSIPPPVIFRIGGSMNTDKSATRMNISLKCSFLLGIEHIKGRTEKYNGGILF